MPVGALLKFYLDWMLYQTNYRLLLLFRSDSQRTCVYVHIAKGSACVELTHKQHSSTISYAALHYCVPLYIIHTFYRFCINIVCARYAFRRRIHHAHAHRKPETADHQPAQP